MKLRHQLFLVSLLLLSLPWAGCQYLQAVDLALRDIQAAALKINAESIASRLVTQPQLFTEPHTNVTKGALPLYTSPLDSLPIIDGYEDDWRAYRVGKKRASSENISADIQIGEYRDRIYFFITVFDDQLRYYNPAQGGDLSSDHLVLTVYDNKSADKEIFLFASAPGRIIARYRDQEGRQQTTNSIKGIWREQQQGYQLELEIDKPLLKAGFNLDIVDARDQQENRLFLNDTLAEEAIYDNLEIVSLSKLVQDELSAIGLDDSSVYVLNNDYLTIAVKEAKKITSQDDTTPWFIEWLYRKALSIDTLPTRSSLVEGNQWLIPRLDDTVIWYRIPKPIVSDQTAVMVTQALYIDGRQIGVLLLEKTSDQLVAVTNSAFNRLFMYSLAVFMLLAVGLLFYASWLSWRISRLNRSATGAVGADGFIKAEAMDWPELNAGDELGDLSRSYQKLLHRLRENQDYLRDLSSKLSHELRTPIAIVKSSLDNLTQVSVLNEDSFHQHGSSEHSSNKKQQYCDRAKEGIERLSYILNAMSAANRIEESMASAEFVDTDLPELMTSLVAMYKDIYPHNPIALHVDIEAKDDLSKARLSPELFVQMMDKLVDNAVSFSPRGEAITLCLRSQSENIIISVDNIGPLLPQAMTGRLFDSMVSIRKGAKMGDKVHLGLGLYIVRLIAELHDAEVKAENREDGNGVIFSVRLAGVKTS